MAEPTEQSPTPPDAEKSRRFELFKRIQEIAKDNPTANQTVVNVYGVDSVDVGDMVGILEGKPFIDIKDLGSGDVLTFDTKSGTKWLYLVNQAAVDDAGSRGDLRRIDSQGIVADYEDVLLSGSTVGSMLIKNKLFLSGLPVEFILPSQIDTKNMTNEQRAQAIDTHGLSKIMPSRLTSSLVVHASVIRASGLNS